MPTVIKRIDGEDEKTLNELVKSLVEAAMKVTRGQSATADAVEAPKSALDKFIEEYATKYLCVTSGKAVQSFLPEYKGCVQVVYLASTIISDYDRKELQVNRDTIVRSLINKTKHLISPDPKHYVLSKLSPKEQEDARRGSAPSGGEGAEKGPKLR